MNCFISRDRYGFTPIDRSSGQQMPRSLELCFAQTKKRPVQTVTHSLVGASCAFVLVRPCHPRNHPGFWRVNFNRPPMQLPYSALGPAESSFPSACNGYQRAGCTADGPKSSPGVLLLTAMFEMCSSARSIGSSRYGGCELRQAKRYILKASTTSISGSIADIPWHNITAVSFFRLFPPFTPPGSGSFPFR